MKRNQAEIKVKLINLNKICREEAKEGDCTSEFSTRSIRSLRVSFRFGRKIHRFKISKKLC